MEDVVSWDAHGVALKDVVQLGPVVEVEVVVEDVLQAIPV